LKKKNAEGLKAKRGRDKKKSFAFERKKRGFKREKDQQI